MSVKVNLLPREAFAKQAAARQRAVAGGAGLLLLLILAGVYFLQSNALSDAQEDRELAQAELNELEAREAQLAEFGDLQQRVEEADARVAAAMDDELSFAAMLQDIAVVMPNDAAFNSLEVTAIEDQAPDGDAPRRVVAQILASGETLRGHAPGVERLLIELDKIASFFDVYVSNSSVDPEQGDADEDVAVFTIEIGVGDEARTHRYDEGVPEELR